MSKNFTLFILSDSGSSTKQATFSGKILALVSLVAVVFVVSLGIASYDYLNLKFSSVESEKLKSELEDNLIEMADQRRQIQRFANEINVLKQELVELNGFENKIRIIANIEKKEDQFGLFGIGGSIPEDLDTGMPLTQKHNSLVREMHGRMENIHIATIKQKEGFETLLKTLEDQKNLLASTPAVKPVEGGWLTSRFGYRESPFTGRREFHKGVDIANRRGTPVMATADGVVSFVGKKGLLGNVVVLDHGHGLVTRYAHLQKWLVKRGEKVKRGDVIAKMGNTGRSTGPHVHYEVRLNSIPVNPEKYILN